MFLQQAGIPDNMSFLVLGLVVLLGLFGGWIASLFWRMRNLRKNLALLNRQDVD